MHGADVIGHRIEDQLHSPPMQRVGQMAQVSHGAEMGVGAIEIRRAVAVVGLGSAIVVIHGRSPQGGDAELLEIVKMLLNSAKIPAMPAAREIPL